MAIAVASSPGSAERLSIAEVRLQDFRSFSDCCVSLETRTLLVGENNSGKSTFLHALSLCLSGGQPREDDFRSVNGSRLPEFTIDVRVEPHGPSATFDASLTQVIGTAIQGSASDGKAYFTLRYRSRLNPGDGPTFVRTFVRGWANNRAEAANLVELAQPHVTQKHRDLVTFTLLDARRDIVTEIRNRRSHWGRLLSDLQLPDAQRSKLESDLKTISEAVLKDSSRLTTIQDALRAISSVISRNDLGVHVAALPSNVNELVRYVDLLVGEQAQVALPVDQQGMGTRSLLSIMLFRAFVDEVLKASAAYTLPVTAIEEPEAHVHPHVQRALLPELHKLRGQVLVSTHAPGIAAVADVFSVRLFRAGKSGSTVRQLSRQDAKRKPRLDAVGVTLLHRFIQKRNADLFFCRVAALYEGDTEDAALDVFAQATLKASASAAGVSLVNVQGAGNYKHFIPFLEDLGIPWVILSDADGAGTEGVAAAAKALGRPLDATSPQLVFYSSGNDFEAQIIEDGLRPQAESAIAKFYTPTALADHKVRLHGSKGRGAVIRDYTSTGWEDRLVHDFLDLNKGSFGSAFAEEVLAAGKAMPHVTAFFSKVMAFL